MVAKLHKDDLEALKKLENRKGELSRKIGQSKRAGESIERLVEEMKLVTSKMKQLLAAQDTAPSFNEATGNPTQQENRQDDTPLFLRDAIYDSKLSEFRVELADSSSGHWDQYLENKVGSNGFLRMGFRELIEQSFGHRCFYLNAVSQASKVVGVLPLVHIKSYLFGSYFVSVPYFNYGGVLADSKEIEEALMNRAVQLAEQHGAEYIELRGVSKRDDWPQKSNKVSMLLRLPLSSESLFNNVGSKVRAQIRKADRFEYRFKLGKQELVSDFYSVFAHNMRDLGTPVYSKKFFMGLFQNYLADDVEVAVLYLDRKPVSAGILIGYKDTIEIPWASTLRAANSKNANMMFYWKVLQSAIEKKYNYFDFGRSTKDAGTYRFKRQWGAKPVPLYWSYWLPNGGDLPELNPDNPKYKLLIAIWQKLPVWLTRIIGPPVVKNLP